MRMSLLKGLSEEQVKKVQACSSTEEILKVAKNENMELTEEQLEAVTGGACADDKRKCPYCGFENIEAVNTYGENGLSYYYVCKGCQRQFND